jgi:hypothetical protein
MQLQRQHELDEAAANDAIQRAMLEDLRRQQQVLGRSRVIAIRRSISVLTLLTSARRKRWCNCMTCSVAGTGPLPPTVTTSPSPLRFAKRYSPRPSFDVVTTLRWSPSLLNPRPGSGAFEMYLYRPAASLPMRRYDWRR